jgi:hypothetical protein
MYDMVSMESKTTDDSVSRLNVNTIDSIVNKCVEAYKKA